MHHRCNCTEKETCVKHTVVCPPLVCMSNINKPLNSDKSHALDSIIIIIIITARVDWQWCNCSVMNTLRKTNILENYTVSQISYAFQQCKMFENWLTFNKVTESSKVGTFFEKVYFRNSVMMQMMKHAIVRKLDIASVSITIDRWTGGRAPV